MFKHSQNVILYQFSQQSPVDRFAPKFGVAVRFMGVIICDIFCNQYRGFDSKEGSNFAVPRCCRR